MVRLSLFEEGKILVSEAGMVKCGRGALEVFERADVRFLGTIGACFYFRIVSSKIEHVKLYTYHVSCGVVVLVEKTSF